MTSKNILIEPDSWQAWFRLTLIFIICVIGCIGMWSIIIIMPSLQNEFNIDRSSSTIPYITTMIGFGLGNIVIGKFLDKFGIQKPIIFSFLFLMLCFYLSIFCYNVTLVSSIQFFLGFFSGVFFGPMMADVTNYFYKRRGIAVSIVASGQHFSGAAWPFLLKNIIENSDWRDAHLFIIILSSLILLPTFYFIFKMKPKIKNVSKTNTTESNTNQNKKLSITNKKLQILLMLAGIGCCVGMSTPQVHIIPLCIDKGYGLLIGSNILSLMLFAAVISRLLFGYIADIIGPIETLLLGSSLQAMTLFLFIPFNDLNSLYIISFLFGLVQGGIVPSYALIIRKFLPHKETAERVGLVIFTTVIGMSIGGWMSGKIFDLTQSYTLGFLNSVLWNVVNILIVLYIYFIYKKIIFKKVEISE